METEKKPGRLMRTLSRVGSFVVARKSTTEKKMPLEQMRGFCIQAGVTLVFFATVPLWCKTVGPTSECRRLVCWLWLGIWEGCVGERWIESPQARNLALDYCTTYLAKRNPKRGTTLTADLARTTATLLRKLAGIMKDKSPGNAAKRCREAEAIIYSLCEEWALVDTSFLSDHLRILRAQAPASVDEGRHSVLAAIKATYQALQGIVYLDKYIPTPPDWITTSSPKAPQKPRRRDAAAKSVITDTSPSFDELQAKTPKKPRCHDAAAKSVITDTSPSFDELQAKTPKKPRRHDAAAKSVTTDSSPPFDELQDNTHQKPRRHDATTPKGTDCQLLILKITGLRKEVERKDSDRADESRADHDNLRKLEAQLLSDHIANCDKAHFI